MFSYIKKNFDDEIQMITERKYNDQKNMQSLNLINNFWTINICRVTDLTYPRSTPAYIDDWKFVLMRNIL